MFLECYFLCFSAPTFTSSIPPAMFTGVCSLPENLFGAALVCSLHDCETRLYNTFKEHFFYTPKPQSLSPKKAPCIDQDQSHILASQHQVQGALMLHRSEVAHPLKQEKQQQQQQQQQSAKLQNTPHLPITSGTLSACRSFSRSER